MGGRMRRLLVIGATLSVLLIASPVLAKSARHVRCEVKIGSVGNPHDDG